MKILSKRFIQPALIATTLNVFQDRDKSSARIHLGDTIEELKKFNARRKLKSAVKAAVSSPKWLITYSEPNGDSYYEACDDEVITSGTLNGSLGDYRSGRGVAAVALLLPCTATTTTTTTRVDLTGPRYLFFHFKKLTSCNDDKWTEQRDTFTTRMTNF